MTTLATVSLRALLVAAVLTAVALGMQPDAASLVANGLSRNGIEATGTVNLGAATVLGVTLPQVAGTH